MNSSSEEKKETGNRRVDNNCHTNNSVGYFLNKGTTEEEPNKFPLAEQKAIQQQQ